MYDSGHDDDVRVIRLRPDKNKLLMFGKLTRASIGVANDHFIC